MEINNAEHTILLVDDEENTLRSLKRLLLDADYIIITASSGAEGLALLDANEVSVIVSDQRMPEMNGSEFLTRARDKMPDTIRILLTGYPDMSETIDAINRGAIYKFINKPFDEGDLKRTLHEAVERYCLIKENKRLSLELKQQNACLEEQVSAQKHDIAERRRAEAELREVSHVNEQIILCAQEGVIVYGPDLRYLFWNSFMEQLSGIAASDVLGKHPWEVFSFLQNSGVVEKLKKALAGETSDFMGHPYYISATGKSGWVEEKMSPLRNTKGEITGVIGTVRESTARKQAEDALQESRQRFQGLIETLYDWIWEVDTQGQYTYVSPRIKDILGYEPEELLGKMPFEIMPGEEGQRVLKIFGPLTAEQKPIIDLENITLHKDGHPVVMETSGLPFYDSKGNFKGYRGTDRDITERKQAEEELELHRKHLELLVDTKTAELREAKTYLENIFQTTGEAIIATDSLGYIVLANCNANEMFGYSDQEFKGLHFSECAAEVFDFGLTPPLIEELFSREYIKNREMRYKKKDGSAFDAEINLALLKDPEGNMQGVVSSIRDITERKQAEAHRDQQLLFSTALNKIAEVIITKNNSEDILESSNRIIGETLQLDRSLIYDVSFDKNCIIGLCEWLKLKHPDIAPTKGEYPLDMFLSSFTEIKNTGKYLDSQFNAVNEHFIEDGSGKILHEQMNIKSLMWYPFAFDEHGYYVFTLNQILEQRQWKQEEIGFLESVAKQISLALIKIKLLEERKHAEEKLLRLATAIEQAQETVKIINPDGVVQYVNKAVEKLTGKKREEITGENILESTQLSDQLRQAWRTVAEGKNLTELNIKRNFTGAPFEFELSMSPVCDEKGIVTSIISIGRNVTKERQLEQQLFQTQKMESIGTLAGGIAHDFNNILAGMLSFTEIVKDKLPKDTKLTHYIDQILKLINRAANLVQQILTFSRKTDNVRTPMQLSPLIKEVLNMLRATLPKTIEIRQKLLDQGSLVEADPTQIHQVLMNLCTNAFHAMEENGGALELELTRVSLNREDINTCQDIEPGHYVLLKVRDTGAGIDPEIISRIFDPFFTTKEVGKGTGLGLSVVHGIIKNHGGDIAATSEPGKGTTFSILLPEVSAPAEIDHGENNSKPLSGTEHILFVDDEENITSAVKILLEALGYKVTAVQSSREALELFQKGIEQFDLVITDLTMPQMNGYELAQRLVKVRPDLPVILCTGYNETVLENKKKDKSIKSVLKKPVSKRMLGETIRKVLNTR